MFAQYRNKIIALVTAICLSVSLGVVPAGAAEVDNLATAEMIEYLENAPFDAVSVLSDTSGATITMTTPITDSTISVHSSCEVSGLGTPDTYYRFMVLLMEKDTSTIIYQGYSDTFTSVRQGWTWTYHYLKPETNYSIGFFLVDGSTLVSSVGVAQSFTTPAQGEAVSNSFLSAIYSKLVEIVNDGENNQILLTALLSQHLSTNSLLGTVISSLESISDAMVTMYTKLYQIEANTGELVALLTPSEQEIALKDATADVTAAYTETFWGEGGSGFGRADVESTGFILQNSKEMFDTGVSVSDFFSMFGTYGWGNWFSEETRADLDTVPSTSTLDLYAEDELSTYEKNLIEIQNFVGG